MMPFDEVGDVRDSAIANPWLTGQHQELCKFYISWMSIIRMIWRMGEGGDEEDDEIDTFLNGETDACLQKTGTGSVTLFMTHDRI
jgi:hypothetical protein